MNTAPPACIRSDQKTQSDGHEPGSLVWASLCGVMRPTPSYSERHGLLMVTGIVPISVPICPVCRTLLAEKHVIPLSAESSVGNR
jgi:hypothetical protein